MTPTGTARFHLWEYAFFSGAAGALALYPFAADGIPAAFENIALLLALALASAAAFLAVTFHSRFHERGVPRSALFSAISFGALLLLAGYAGSATSPVFAVWFVDAAIAIFAFGHLFAKRLFGRVERDFSHHAGDLLAASFGANAILVLLVAAASALPPVLIACGALAAFLVFASQ